MTDAPMIQPPRRRSTLRRVLLAAGLLVGGGAGVAYAMAGPFGGGFGPGGFGHRDPAQRLERMQAMARRALDGVGATSDQENKVHDIIASAFTAMQKEAKSDDDTRRRLADLLKAPSVDRAAIEALRGETMRSLDARSKIVAGALADAAGQLSAEQRTQLADRMAAMMERRRGFGGWHRRDDGPGRPDRGPGEGGPRPN
ncbi:periplasmic heavy metal sensor [Methylobacterium oryzihabitans]|nr:periplasmic heavy metal sensor [Methylobacterium oryzihabitans]